MRKKFFGSSDSYREYLKFIDKQRETESTYSKSLSKNAIFNQIYELIMSLPLPLTSTDKEEEIDLLKIKRNALKGAKEILDGVNLDVNILKESNPERKIFTISHQNDMERKILEVTHIGSVFDIPIKKTSKHNSFIKSFRCQQTDYRNVIFASIQLGSPNIPTLVEGEYCHELGHALIKRNIRSHINPLFDEYVSMFMEFMYLFFSKDGLYFFKKKCIDRFDDREEIVLSEPFSMRYLVSLLLSIITIEQFLEFSIEDRNEMMIEFKKILNGELTIEQFLDEYEINLISEKSLVMVDRTIQRIHI